MPVMKKLGGLKNVENYLITKACFPNVKSFPNVENVENCFMLSKQGEREKKIENMFDFLFFCSEKHKKHSI